MTKFLCSYSSTHH